MIMCSQIHLAEMTSDSSSSAPSALQVPCTDLLHGMPTPELEDEVRNLFDLRYSTSSKSSIDASLAHWDVVRARYMWPRTISTGDPGRGSKLAVFVFYLMSLPACYPSSTISNYVWALSAYMQLQLQADPRVNVIGWTFFIQAVYVLCYVPTEPRKRVSTLLIRAALAAVDRTNFVLVQTALLVLFLYFTFQRSELPCPKTYDGLDSMKHLLVKHMEPYEGGSRWAVGATKSDPRAERLSGDAGPGREWIVVGEVNDDLMDMRVWLSLFCRLLPPGPRDPDSPFFLAHDKVRCLTYSVALQDFRTFLWLGGCTDPEAYGLHGVRSEAFITCSGAVSDEAAVIQGGWSTRVTASRYDRLTLPVALSIAPKMVAFHSATPSSSTDQAARTSPGASRSAGGLRVVAARAAARAAGSSRQEVRSAFAAHSRQSGAQPAAPSAFQQANLPAGWTRVWHPTSGRRAGYQSFVGPCGQKARSVAEAQRKAAPASRPAAPRARWDVPVTGASSGGAASIYHSFPDDLSDYVHYSERPSSRPPPRARIV